MKQTRQAVHAIKQFILLRCLWYTHRESLGEKKNMGMTLFQNGLTIFSYFHSNYKELFVVHLKHSTFWPSADAKLMSNDLVQAMPWQCMSAPYMCTLRSQWLAHSYTLPKAATAYDMSRIPHTWQVK